MNYNVTATVDTSGNVTQRYVYSPYGVQMAFTAPWATSSAANSTYGFQGGRTDPATGLVHFGTPGRDYDPVSGIWREQDGGFWDGLNLYQAFDTNPVRRVDPSGADPAPLINPTGGSSQPATTQSTQISRNTLDQIYTDLGSNDWRVREAAQDAIAKALDNGSMTQADYDDLKRRNEYDTDDWKAERRTRLEVAKSICENIPISRLKAVVEAEKRRYSDLEKTQRELMQQISDRTCL